MKETEDSQQSLVHINKFALFEYQKYCEILNKEIKSKVRDLQKGCSVANQEKDQVETLIFKKFK